MPTPLFKNKKAQVVDVLGGIQRAVTWLLQSAPKPLLLILFLLFLVLFSSIFGFILNTTGNFCDTAGNEYRTSTFSILTNFQLIGEMPDNDQLNSEEIPADEKTAAIFLKCTRFITNPYYYEGGFFDNDKLFLENGSGYYYDGSFCTDCESDELFDNLTKDNGKYCTGDVYRIERDDKTYLQKTFCGGQACEPPEGYYYDRETNNYICISELCSNENGSAQTVGNLWNLKLIEAGAELQPPSQHGDRDYRNAVRVECDAGDIKPNLRVFGINVFDYKLWLMLIILSALIWVVFKIKRH